MERENKPNADSGRRMDRGSDKLDHQEFHGMFGIDADSLDDPDGEMASHQGSFGRVFHGDTANAWRHTAGMLPGKNQRYLRHDDYHDQDDDGENDGLTDLHLPPED